MPVSLGSPGALACMRCTAFSFNFSCTKNNEQMLSGTHGYLHERGILITIQALSICSAIACLEGSVHDLNPLAL